MDVVTPELESVAASDHDFSPEECVARAREAARVVDPDALADENARQRIYELLWRNEHSEAWLLSWNEPRDTGYHDHDGSCVGVHVISGTASNEALMYGPGRRVREYGPGDSFHFPGGGIHRMEHEPGAITIHVYSPPIRSLGHYEIVEGMLQRTPGGPEEPSPPSPELLNAQSHR